MQGDTLFIIASPFQCLCAFEAIHRFDIRNPFFIISSDFKSIKMVQDLLESKSYPFKLFIPQNFIKNILTLVKEKHGEYQNIFIGNLEAHVFNTIGCIYSKRNAQFFYLDDGIQALQLFSKQYVRPPFDLKKHIQDSFNKLLCKIKQFRKPIYYTIFDVNTEQYIVLKNNLSSFRPAGGLDKKGVYVIGTNSSVLKFAEHTYSEYLSALFSHISNKFPDTPIYYCPHRRDINNELANNVCSTYGVIQFSTKVSVEYDFIENSIVPEAIYGFTSNALYTLKMLYPATIVQTVMYHLQDAVSDKNTQTIREQLDRYNVKTLAVL